MFGFGKWLNMEIFELRAGGIIRIIKDNVQRREEKDGSQCYYMKNAKDTLESQEFEDIYVDVNGRQELKVFSPTKGVYFPINFMFKKIRGFTKEEQNKINNAKTEDEKKKITREVYANIYKAQFDIRVDTDTLNHFIYKIRKNKLRLQTGGGLSPTMILTLMVVFMAVAFLIMSWASYNYSFKPQMEFWEKQGPQILEMYKNICPAIAQNSIQQPVPVG